MRFTKFSDGFRSSFEIRELKHRRFWAMDVNRKSKLLLFDLYNSLFVENNLEFTTNLAISFRSCQSNRVREFHAELRWEVNKFIAREVCTIRWNCLRISLYVVVTCSSMAKLTADLNHDLGTRTHLGSLRHAGDSSKIKGLMMANLLPGGRKYSSNKHWISVELRSKLQFP